MSPIIIAAFALIGVAVVLTVIRMILGPTSYDRLMAADVLAVSSAAFLALFSVISGGKEFYIDVAIVDAVLGFIGVVTIARFLKGGDK